MINTGIDLLFPTIPYISWKRFFYCFIFTYIFLKFQKNRVLFIEIKVNEFFRTLLVELELK